MVRFVFKMKVSKFLKQCDEGSRNSYEYIGQINHFYHRVRTDRLRNPQHAHTYSSLALKAYQAKFNRTSRKTNVDDYNSSLIA